MQITPAQARTLGNVLLNEINEDCTDTVAIHHVKGGDIGVSHFGPYYEGGRLRKYISEEGKVIG